MTRRPLAETQEEPGLPEFAVPPEFELLLAETRLRLAHRATEAQRGREHVRALTPTVAYTVIALALLGFIIWLANRFGNTQPELVKTTISQLTTVGLAILAGFGLGKRGRS